MRCASSFGCCVHRRVALIVELAGGRASTGRERIMTITPATHHQRVPLPVGSPEDVTLAEDFATGRR